MWRIAGTVLAGVGSVGLWEVKRRLTPPVRLGPLDIPDDMDSFTVEWLRAAVGCEDIIGFQMKPLGNQGVTGSIASRITLAYSNPPPAGIHDVHRPAAVILKYTKSGVFKQPLAERMARKFMMKFDADRLMFTEHQFYSDFQPEAGLPTPHVYYSGAIDDGQPLFILGCMGIHSSSRAALILEDLTLRPGNKLYGFKPVSTPHAEELARALGRVHAKYWGVPSQRTPPCGLMGIALALPSFTRTPKKIQALIERWGRVLNVDTPELRDMWATFPESYNHLKPIVTGTQAAVTFCHGDMHGNNVFFSDEGPAIFDLQLWGPGYGTYELGYFINASVPFEGIVPVARAYHDALLEGGVINYDYDRFKLELDAYLAIQPAGPVAIFSQDTVEAWERKAAADPAKAEMFEALTSMIPRAMDRAGRVYAEDDGTLFPSKRRAASE